MKEFSTFMDGGDCRECDAYLKEIAQLKKQLAFEKDRGDNNFEQAKLKDVQIAALLEENKRLREALENLLRQVYGQTHSWAGMWTKCACSNMWAFGGNWNECEPTDSCPMCVATKVLSQGESK